MARGRRRVRRVVRRVDPWSVLKVSIFFFISLVVVLLIGFVILWSLAQSSGAVGKVEKFMQDLGFTDFKFRGKEIFRLCLFGGGVLAVAGTIFATIMAFLYNLISDLVGGIEVQVLEEESAVAGPEGAMVADRRAKRDQRRGQRQRVPGRPRQPAPGHAPPVPPAPQPARRTVV